MPPRIKGPLEERLLEAARRRLKRAHGAEHGGQVAFGNAIGKPESWVSAYLDGTRYPNLDTYIAIADYCGFSLPELRGDIDPQPKLSAEALRVAQLWDEIPRSKRPALRSVMEGYRVPRVEDPPQSERRSADRPQAGRRSRRRKRGA